jgi:hypothetical protein
MFQWDRSICKLDVSAGEVIRLFRSVSDVQLALPGLPAQAATAYLCQHAAGGRALTSVALYLHSSQRLAFYRDTLGGVTFEQAPVLLEKALDYLAAMGFLMTDLDLQILNGHDRERLWAALPLQCGVIPDKQPPPAVAATPAPAAEQPHGRTGGGAAAAKPAEISSASLAPPGRAAPLAAGTTAAGLERGISLVKPAAPVARPGDDLLRPVAALREVPPEPAPGRQPPGVAELDRRRRELRTVLGRILASL